MLDPDNPPRVCRSGGICSKTQVDWHTGLIIQHKNSIFLETIFFLKKISNLWLAFKWKNKAAALKCLWNKQTGIKSSWCSCEDWFYRLIPLPQRLSQWCVDFRWMVTHLPWAGRNLEQVRLGKSQPVFSSDDVSAGTWQLCSSEAGSSLVWEVLLDAGAFTEVSKGVVRAWLSSGGRRKGLWFPKKGGSPFCITPREARGCFLCLTWIYFGTDYGMWENVFLSPERPGENFDLM